MLLEIKNLYVNFKGMHGTTEALKNINLAVAQGEIVGIVGESGSGKSITSMAILGLLEKNAIIPQGEIIYEGRDLLKLDNKQLQQLRGKEIGMVFQEPMTALQPTMKIGKQLFHVMKKHRGLSNEETKKAVLQALKDVHIDNPELVANKYPFELSGGMRQRIVIALAMAAPPNLLIADEPTTALDVTIQYEIINLIKELNEKRGTSVLFISHDLGVISNVCERILVMYAGEVVESGKTEEVLTRPRHPYTKSLLRALPDAAAPDEPLQAIDGEPPNLLQRPNGCAFSNRCNVAIDKCRSEHPQLVESSEGHHVSCWLEKVTV